MKPEEKAKELVNRFIKLKYSVNGFKHITELEHEAAVECALVCVDELNRKSSHQLYDYYYFKDVKQEINKLKTIKL